MDIKLVFDRKPMFIPKLFKGFEGLTHLTLNMLLINQPKIDMTDMSLHRYAQISSKDLISIDNYLPNLELIEIRNYLSDLDLLGYALSRFSRLQVIKILEIN